jgi:acylphosphatase
MADDQRLDVQVYGRVQGVGYRAFAREQGRRLGLCGWVRNDPDSSVRVVAEGPRDVLERLLQVLERGPSMARVERVEPYWSAASGEFEGFAVRFF